MPEPCHAWTERCRQQIQSRDIRKWPCVRRPIPGSPQWQRRLQRRLGNGAPYLAPDGHGCARSPAFGSEMGGTFRPKRGCSSGDQRRGKQHARSCHFCPAAVRDCPSSGAKRAATICVDTKQRKFGCRHPWSARQQERPSCRAFERRALRHQTIKMQIGTRTRPRCLVFPAAKVVRPSDLRPAARQSKRRAKRYQP
jgi:hypothetical protein